MSGCVHCNCCGAFPSSENTSFSLSNCGHIFCKGCIDKGQLSVKCNQCGAAAPKFLTIDRNLNPNLQIMFKKPVQLLAEHTEELAPLMKFQNSQRTMRLKGQQMLAKQEKEKRMELQSQVTTMRDQMKAMQRQYNEGARSRNSSLESMRSVRGANASETSSLLHQHTMSSSVSSNETTMYLDPFKTPVNGLKRFTTSTPKMHRPPAEGQPMRKMPANGMMSSRHSSSVPTLSSFAMEIDDDIEIMDVTPAPRHHHSRLPMDTPQLLQMQPPSQQQPQPPTLIRQKHGGSSSSMVIDYDPILGSGGPKTPLPKTPAPKKGLQSLSMAERLSAPPHRTKTPQKQLQQPEVTSSTTPGGGAAINKPKTPCATPLLASILKPSPITPIRPIHGSQLSLSSAASAKHPEKSNTSAFKTPSLPAVKKPSIAPRTMPAGMKMGSASSLFSSSGRLASGAGTSQQFPQ